MSALMICILQQVLAASVKVDFILHMETVFYSVLHLLQNNTKIWTFNHASCFYQILYL